MINSFFSFWFLLFLNLFLSLVFLKNFMNLLAIIAISLSLSSLSSSLSYFDTLSAIFIFFFSSLPSSAIKPSSFEIREPIKSLISKVFKSLVSSIVVLLTLHSVGKDLMIFLIFSLFEKVFPRPIECLLYM